VSPNSSSPSQQIVDVVTSWPGVTTGHGNRGELWFRVGRREIGHLHGDAAAHFGFPRHVWITLRKQGRIESHPVFVDLVGPAARRIEAESDIQAVIDLLRLNYERLTTLAGGRSIVAPTSSPSFGG
jgi:hypothetical protein